MKMIFILMMIFSMTAFSADLSPAEFFRRCSIHLTGKPVPWQSVAAARIKRGEITAQQACEDLLAAGHLSSTGILENNNQTGKDVLKTFLNFHRTWFSANTLEQIQDYNEEIGRGTVDFYDPNEPALALTRSLFAKGSSFSEVLTLPTGVKGLRVEDEAVRNRFDFTSSLAGRRVLGNGFNEGIQASFRNIDAAWAGGTQLRLGLITPVAVGDLIGIRPTSDSFQVPNFDLHPLGQSTSGYLVPYLNYSFDFFKTQGGGVLGTPVFLLMNLGHPIGYTANGSTKLPRRWIKSAMESLLCLNFPALREADIEKFYVGNSSAPFRNGRSCLQCHGTLDQAAYTGRQITTGATDFFAVPNYPNKYPLVLTTYKATKDSVVGWPSEPVPDFHLQNPKGSLYFRSASGELVNKSVNNIAELGQAMSQTDDFYNCASRRYFEYFTGIHVPIYDRTDPANAGLNRSLTDQDLKDRKYIEALGAELKKTQSLEQMIKTILSSTYYRSGNYRP